MSGMFWSAMESTASWTRLNRSESGPAAAPSSVLAVAEGEDTRHLPRVEAAEERPTAREEAFWTTRLRCLPVVCSYVAKRMAAFDWPLVGTLQISIGV